MGFFKDSESDRIEIVPDRYGYGMDSCMQWGGGLNVIDTRVVEKRRAENLHSTFIDSYQIFVGCENRSMNE